MARRPTTRVVLNRAALTEVRRAVADGAFEVGRQAIIAVRPPDAPPYGRGLVDRGGAIGYVDGKKVAGFGLDGREPKKPRAARTGRGVTVIAGWGFPARFLEFGTVKMPAYPFFAQTVFAVAERAEEIMRPIVSRVLGRRA